MSLTFDDGRASQDRARRILAGHGLVGTFYVNSGLVGEPRYLGWDEVDALAADAHEIGGHTVSHPHLPEVPVEDARREIGADREAVTVRDLFEHCSGLPAYRRYFEQLAGRPAYESAIGREPLTYQPRTQSLYSDPGFMLLGFVLEDARQESLDRQFDRWRERVGITEPLRFNPPESWRDRIAPTEQDAWRGRLIVGEVHDENAAALGGVAAHAGLFGTAAAVGAAGRWWLSLLRGTDDVAMTLQARDAATFAERSTVPGSSRALGWDTMVTTSSCGTCLSPRAIGHTGFTGTTLWMDPEHDVYFVLLTNRVHPTRNNDRIQPVRRAFHDAAIADILEQA